ncbi:hypothetical protein AA0113_g5165 [Alternaria arborescens]|uniref:Uncharacterized protein n=1 Tax=Alternaria arborescens TaxID=156630 RepID=A0A4Q4SBG0_9PLEO|nr:hypothetical protein AA0112_g8555 [Alternaria arborescens]RYO67033.1 hypothetical protein AA0113_g5165 [Alternaria arborescens]
MSDEEQKTPSKAASSGGAWSEQEKIAYLMILCEHAADTEKFESKTNTCPVPAGRTTLSCRKLILRMKEKHGEDMEKIKNGLPLGPAAGDGVGATLDKPKTTPKKRKNKTVEGEDDPAESSPKKKATPRPRKKKNEAVEVKDEEMI